MEITKIENKSIHQVKTLWEKLNQHHWRNSNNFKEHFKSFNFEDRIKEFETRDAVAVFAAKEDSEFIGYCIASLKDQTGEIDSIYISPVHRNEKIGEKLIEKAESWLKQKGAIKILVCVAEGNESAIGFYHKKGYLHRITVLEKSLDGVVIDLAL